jgi:hypothetical protein
MQLQKAGVYVLPACFKQTFCENGAFIFVWGYMKDLVYSVPIDAIEF